MVDFTDLKEYLKESVFLRDDLKKTAEIIHFRPAKNSYNEKVIQFDSQDVIEGIPINYTSAKKRYDRFGIYSDSSVVFLVPYDTEIEIIDKIYIYDQYFDIRGIDDYTGGQEASLGRKVFLVQTNVNMPTPTELLDWNTDLDDVIQFKIN